MIFRDDEDRQGYLDRLSAYREKHGFRLLAYCLMSNHLHLVVQTGPVALSRVMHGLHSSFTQAFNRRHDRVGHLFQGRYKAFLVEKERYLLSLIKYVHENPVRARLVRRAADYPWSSDRCYRRGEGPDWLDMEPVLSTLAGRRTAAVARYRELMAGDQGAESYERLQVYAGAIKGGDEFAARMLKGNEVSLPRSIGKVTAARLAVAVAEVEGVTLGELRSPGRRRPGVRARALAGFVARGMGISVARMARYFNRDESSLVRGVLALEREVGANPELRARVAEIRRLLE